jgi:hypothetical protein
MKSDTFIIEKEKGSEYSGAASLMLAAVGTREP